MKVYTIKNVLRDGIGIAEVEPVPGRPGAVYEPRYGGAWGVYGPGEWCEDGGVAVEYAEAARKHAIHAYERQLALLKAMRFTLPRPETTDS